MRKSFIGIWLLSDLGFLRITNKIIDVMPNKTAPTVISATKLLVSSAVGSTVRVASCGYASRLSPTPSPSVSSVSEASSGKASNWSSKPSPVSYTHLRAHETS